MKTKPRFLVCPPDFYDVDYVINPWMEGNVHKASPAVAAGQWAALEKVLEKDAALERIAPRPGLPDMVFTANAGVVIDRKCALSRFLPRERRGEEPHFKKWFKKQRFEVFELPPDLPFEGAGDALFDGERSCLWAGYGFRTDLSAHPLLADWLNIEVRSLRLVDPRFYHLDTCLCPLEGGWLMYYPAAFDARSNRLFERTVPAERRIPVGETDAARFACNAINVGRRVILDQASPELRRRMEAAGFSVVETPLGEFMKAGGSARCLTLRLTDAAPPGAMAGTTVRSREVRLEGHLLDTGLLDRALETTLQTGGSFQILHFNLGKQRQSTSDAEIKISAPSEEILDTVLSAVIELGGVATSARETDAELKAATRAGVAPEEFLATNIYPTEIRVAGTWRPVQGQRMDAVVVVDPKQGTARCALIRDLNVDDMVVTGSAGVRTVRKAESRDDGGRAAAAHEHEFSFMGAAVSSERRVELVVDRISWEMHRLRAQGGRIVIVPGPVVIHTGAAEYLAWLVRAGYVQAVLGGNAIGVHDIEQALMGTSLGVDMKRGKSMEGGHRHHLKAINIIRRCGGIARAVETGVLTSGVFYECVRRGVPFSLAGSIRDDGPLPDTEMDLVKAQAEYARLLKGAGLILMLSTMLHSIGVANMTPSGVRLVCVDINPAVITKLSDRGSIESVGVVTDVGLFLNLLTQRLKRLEPAAATPPSSAGGPPGAPSQEVGG